MAWLLLRVLGQDCLDLAVSQLVTSITSNVIVMTECSTDLVSLFPYSHCHSLLNLLSSEEILVEVVVLE